MTAAKPYLIRAIYEWIVDNEMTPYIAVDAKIEGVQAPSQIIVKGQLLLDISPKASRGLHLDNDRIIFTARFAGVPEQIHIPPRAVLAIYAKENGQGMRFEADGEGGEGEPPVVKPPAEGDKSRKKPKLRIVK